MRETGIDISHQRSKGVRVFLGTPIPYVITVCDSAKEHCPIFPGTYEYLRWSLRDPAAVEGTIDDKLIVFLRVRDEITNRIENFVESHKYGVQKA